MVKSIVGKVGGGIMPLAEILLNFLGRLRLNPDDFRYVGLINSGIEFER